MRTSTKTAVAVGIVGSLFVIPALGWPYPGYSLLTSVLGNLLTIGLYWLALLVVVVLWNSMVPNKLASRQEQIVQNR